MLKSAKTKTTQNHSFSTHRRMQQQHDLLPEYLGLNVCFYTLFCVCILGLNRSTCSILIFVLT